MSKLQVVVTDYIEPDLEWESEEFKRMGVDFEYAQLKFAAPEQLIAFAAKADIVIVNMAKINAAVMDGLRRCKLIIRHGVGYDNVDIAAASARGIVVAYVPDYCMNEVAEQAVMLIMACQRKLLLQQRVLSTSAQKGEWDFAPVYPMYSLHDKTVGIVGIGRIGSTVYCMLQSFGVRFLICDPYLSEPRRRELGIELHPFEHVLRESDIVTTHVPLNAETHHLFDEPQFKMMKRTAILVNTARGGIVNLRALDRALREGLIAHAGIDVWEEKEPPDPDFPLLHNDHAICTPHLSWLSEEAGWNIRKKIVEDVARFLQNKPPRFPVNGDVLIRFND
jgi:D-3-phosphoglycerate dehydrogenase